MIVGPPKAMARISDWRWVSFASLNGKGTVKFFSPGSFTLTVPEIEA